MRDGVIDGVPGAQSAGHGTHNVASSFGSSNTDNTLMVVESWPLPAAGVGPPEGRIEGQRRRSARVLRPWPWPWRRWHVLYQ